MTTPQQPALAYVLKRYPRFSETFIVNEILEHEKAGMRIHIFALRPVRESHFQDILAQVRCKVLPKNFIKSSLILNLYHLLNMKRIIYKSIDIFIY